MHGDVRGLKRSSLRQLEQLYHRRVRADEVLSPSLAAKLAELHRELKRCVGLILDRGGRVQKVTLGDARGVEPPLSARPESLTARFSGMRFIYTSDAPGTPTRRDRALLLRFRLDLIACLCVDEEGHPVAVHRAHLVPGQDGRLWEVLPPLHPNHLPADLRELLGALEDEFRRLDTGTRTATHQERAVLVLVADASGEARTRSLRELAALADSGGARVVGTLSQRRTHPDPGYAIGRGKLEELNLLLFQHGADVVIFGQDITAVQARNLEDELRVKVIDRTQLILDIFAQHARSGAGKLQVELARRRYLLPRLVGGDPGLSRLGGGIGGNRGMGEKKLELDRRRTRDRIAWLEHAIDRLQRRRHLNRKRREQVPVATAALVGYTNAGKSTIFNRLTGSDVAAAPRMFETLDPTCRRLKGAGETLLLTDTVGFIQDLPPDLRAAFRATLEELHSAQLLIHVLDAADPDVFRHREAVEGILKDLDLEGHPRLVVFNQADRLDDLGRVPVRSQGDLLMSAHDPTDLARLEGLIRERLCHVDAA